MLSQAGIDISVFSAHSTRGASSSKAISQGVSVKEIMAMADWSNSSTFSTFYKRKITSKSFTNTVLSLGQYLHVFISFELAMVYLTNFLKYN